MPNPSTTAAERIFQNLATIFQICLQVNQYYEFILLNGRRASENFQRLLALSRMEGAVVNAKTMFQQLEAGLRTKVQKGTHCPTTSVHYHSYSYCDYCLMGRLKLSNLSQGSLSLPHSNLPRAPSHSSHGTKFSKQLPNLTPGFPESDRPRRPTG